jgi:hypothetical protein
MRGRTGAPYSGAGSRGSLRVPDRLLSGTRKLPRDPVVWVDLGQAIEAKAA